MNVVSDTQYAEVDTIRPKRTMQMGGRHALQHGRFHLDIQACLILCHPEISVRARL
jgi:hypothetical protein